jgi:hypothetical protein
MTCEARLDHARVRLQRRGRLTSSPLQRRAAWWTFVQVAVMEPPHTAAERARRPGGRWRTGSCGPQRAAGSRWVDRMLTVGATLQQPQCTILASLPTPRVTQRAVGRRLCAPHTLSKYTLRMMAVSMSCMVTHR